MHEEPEIVRILRDEERLGRLQTKHRESTKEESGSGGASEEESQGSVMMVPLRGNDSNMDLKQDYLRALWDLVLHSVPIALLIFDEQKHLISWNDYAEKLLGDPTNKFIPHSMEEWYPAEEWKNLQPELTESQGLKHQINTKICTSTHQPIDVSLSLCIVRDRNNKPIGTLHLLRERTSEPEVTQRLDAIVDYLDDSISLLDRQGRYLAINNNLLTQLGRTRQDVLGKTFSDFHTQKDTREFSEKLNWVFEHGQPLKGEVRKNAKWYLEIISPIKEPNQDHTAAVLLVSKNITQQKKLRHLLREKEKNYRTVLEVFPQIIFLIDTKGTITDVNERITKSLGYTTQETIGKKLCTSPFFTEETQVIVEKRFSKKASYADATSCDDIEMLTLHGEKRNGTLQITPLKNRHSKIIGHLVVISETVERRQADETSQLGDTSIASSMNALLVTDIEGTITRVNNSFLKMWGYNNENDVIGKPLAYFWKIQEHYLEAMQILRTNCEWVGELTGVKKNHSTFQVQLSAQVIEDECKKQAYIIGSLVDITKYKTAVQALSESEKKFRVVLDNSLYMMYQLDLRKGNYEYVSPSSLNVIGYSPQELTFFGRKQMEEIIHPEDRERVKQHFKELMDTQKTTTTSMRVFEYRIKHKTLGYRWMSDTCSAILDDHHEPIALVGNIEDITDRKKVWDALVKSEEKYRILAETSADGVFTTDALGRLTYVNPSFEKMLGRRKSQILATPFRRYLLEDSIYFFQQVFIDVRRKNEKIENVELELVTEEGSILPIEANIAPLEKQDEFSGVVCTVRDITQRREIEDGLKKNERLKTEFMNIAAHELRSPVTPIKGYLDLIIHDNGTDEKIKNWAKISLRNAERLLKLVNDILDVARLDSDTMRFDMEKIDPIELLTEIAEDVKPAIINKKLEFRITVPEALPHIVGDKIRLSQVLKNLIGNALKFTDYGYIALEAEKNNSHIIISVADTGIGISKDEIKKIFTKFYQAYTGEDRNNEGTGLGLFISKEIVKKHNGSIWAESEVGKGSRFVVELPYVHKMIVDFST
jgi:PAS domain S-box-containing protein